MNEASETTLRDAFEATLLLSLHQVSSANSSSNVLTKRIPPVFGKKKDRYRTGVRVTEDRKNVQHYKLPAKVKLMTHPQA